MCPVLANFISYDSHQHHFSFISPPPHRISLKSGIITTLWFLTVHFISLFIHLLLHLSPAFVLVETTTLHLNFWNKPLLQKYLPVSFSPSQFLSNCALHNNKSPIQTNGFNYSFRRTSFVVDSSFTFAIFFFLFCLLLFCPFFIKPIERRFQSEVQFDGNKCETSLSSCLHIIPEFFGRSGSNHRAEKDALENSFSISNSRRHLFLFIFCVCSIKKKYKNYCEYKSINLFRYTATIRSEQKAPKTSQCI